MDPLPEPAAAPSVKIVPDGPLGREEIMGKAFQAQPVVRT